MSPPQLRSRSARQMRRGKPRPETRPDLASAVQARGLAALQRNEPLAAVAALQEAVHLRPRDPVLFLQLGAALRGAGKLAEAIVAYRSGLDLPPKEVWPLLHNNLGNALRDAGDLAGSLHHLEAAVRIKAEYPEAWHNLGLTLYRSGKASEAEAAVTKALGLKPAYPEALNFLSQLAALRSDFNAAVEAARKAVSLVPGHPEYRLTLGSALTGCGRFEEADQEVEEAARLAPASPEVVYSVARQREQRGDREGAAEGFRRVITAAPSHASAYLALASAAGLDDGALAAAEREAGAPETDPNERSSFAFAIAATYDRRKDYDRAFLWARFANEIDKARTSFDRKEAADFVARSIATFTRESIDDGPTGSADERPLFIVGFPRSGTSLVEQIVASHPAVAAGGELVEIPDMVKELPAPYPDRVPTLPQEELDRLVRRYRSRLDRVDTRAQRITDKLPFNFRNLGLIAMLFPVARIIYCRRDPRDIAISCYLTKFHRPISFAQSLFDMGAYWVLHEKLMRHWRQVLSIPILEVNYEKVVAEPEPQIRRIIDFARLPWDDRCLRFYETQSIVRTASVNQIRNPIYAKSVGRWRHYARHLAPLLFELSGGAPIGTGVQAKRADPQLSANARPHPEMAGGTAE